MKSMLLPLLTGGIVLVRILVNPISNVFQKQLAQKSMEPVIIIGTTHGLLALGLIPLFLLGAVAFPIAGAFWWSIGIAAFLAVTSNVLLVQALKTGDLSILGPLNAYKAPVSMAIAAILISETPTARGVLGVLLIVAGSYLILDRPTGMGASQNVVSFWKNQGIQLRLMALCLSATEAVFLKRALLVSSPLATFAGWAILGVPVAVVAAVFLLPRPVEAGRTLLKQHRWTCLGLAATTGAMQLTTLFTFGKLQVGASLALFQLSALVSVFLGHRYFNEGNLRQRLVGTGVMVAGAMLIVSGGTRP